MSTTTANQARAAALKAARAKDSELKRQRTLAALEALEATGAPITFTAVAKAARVSTWLVYADGIREHIDAARHRQSNHHRADRHADSSQHATGDAGQPAHRPGHRPGAHQDAARRTGQTPAAPAPATRCRARSTRPGPPDRTRRRPREPSTVNSSPNATPAPSRPTPPKVGSPNSKTSYPPHAKACAGSSKPKTAHHDAYLRSRSCPQPHTPTCLTCPTLKNASEQHFFRKSTDNRRHPADQP